MDIIEKAQRLRELAKEMEDVSPAAITMMGAAFELIEELAQGLSAAQEELETLTEQVDDLDDALEELCEDVYGDEDEDETFEVECPNCGELIQIDEGILEEGSITCPGCNENLEFDLGCDCDGCDCEDCAEKE
jgi:uncharacterized coiled-coil protein SlyX